MFRPTEVRRVDTEDLGGVQQLRQRAGVAIVGRAEVDAGHVARGVRHHVVRRRNGLGCRRPAAAGEGEQEVDREAPVGELVAERRGHAMAVVAELPARASRARLGSDRCSAARAGLIGMTKAMKSRSRATAPCRRREADLIGVARFRLRLHNATEAAHRSARARSPGSRSADHGGVVSRCTLRRAFRLPRRALGYGCGSVPDFDRLPPSARDLLSPGRSRARAT